MTRWYEREALLTASIWTYFFLKISKLVFSARCGNRSVHVNRVKGKDSTITEPQAVAVAEEYDAILAHDNPFPGMVTLIHPGVISLARHIFHVNKRLDVFGVDDREYT